jgi:uncharacterized phage protein (TIGR02220 family)
MRTQWNEDENDALLRLPWRARVVYLQGLRWHMDYKTGTVGMTGYTMSYQKLSEVLDCTDAASTKPDPRVNKEGLRSIFRMLERVGLVEWVKSESKGLAFRCLLADLDRSVSDQDNPKTTPRQPQKDNPKDASNGAAYSETGNPKTTPCCTCEDNPPPASVNQEEEGGTNVPDEFAPANVDNDAPTTLPVRHVFDYWRKRTEHSRAKLDDKRRSAIASRLKNGYSVDDLKAAVDGCLKSPWHQGQNGNKRKYDDIELICRNASKVDQFIALASSQNQEDQKLNDWLNSDQIIEGDFSRVR